MVVLDSTLSRSFPRTILPSISNRSKRAAVKILVVHNPYQQLGGEDIVFQQECRLLRRGGHQVVTYCRSNDEIKTLGPFDKIALAPNTIWARNSRQQLAKLLADEKPDLVHVHNTFVMISPSAFSACYDAGIPVVHTLHNYRLMCPSGTFYRQGHVCEDCATRSLWQGIRHGCYHDSSAMTAVVASMIAVHRKLDTWTHPLHYYIALSQFARNKFVESGMPAERIFVKPNFVDPDPGGFENKEDYAVFVGRLSPEKRVSTLLNAWETCAARFPLRILGGGPQLGELQEVAREKNLDGVQFMGQMPRSQAVSTIRKARFLIFSSEWYENFPVTIVEAFASATPVICSRLGAMQEIVTDGRTGIHFEPGNAQDLARKMDWAWFHPEEMRAMGRAARSEYETRYACDKNYLQLIDIYNQVLATRVPQKG
jgi:glycosyltransferase involved in cell wall biosynthesis